MTKKIFLANSSKVGIDAVGKALFLATQNKSELYKIAGEAHHKGKAEIGKFKDAEALAVRMNAITGVTVFYVDEVPKSHSTAGAPTSAARSAAQATANKAGSDYRTLCSKVQSWK